MRKRGRINMPKVSKRRQKKSNGPGRPPARPSNHYIALANQHGHDMDGEGVTSGHDDGSLPSPPGSFACNICQKVLASASTLRDHINGHTREVKYPCGKCGRTFLRSQYLNTHLKVHAKEEQRLALANNLLFKCTLPECMEAFATQQKLEIHLTKHTFQCAFCPRTAASRRALNYHHMKHTGEFPEQCKSCKIWYTSSKVLLSHKCRPKVRPTSMKKAIHADNNFPVSSQG